MKLVLDPPPPKKITFGADQFVMIPTWHKIRCYYTLQPSFKHLCMFKSTSVHVHVFMYSSY
jgi:hypothetical protein